MQLENVYRKMTPLDHILHRPDLYIGNIRPQLLHRSILVANAFQRRDILCPQGLFKIFDEILVNACDNHRRDPRTNLIKVRVSKEQIEIFNNGAGIPVSIHKQHKIYVPQLIFGHLLTSSNYNDQQKRVTGGLNGYGAKLANIFSTCFKIETAQSKTAKKFSMQWRDNMKSHSEAEIQACKEDFTKVTFKPDFKRFGLQSLSEEIMGLFGKRTYDIAGCLGQRVKVYYNNVLIKANSFQLLSKLHLSQSTQLFDLSSADNPCWQVLFAVSGDRQNVSFVNGINTYRGGTHVQHVQSQLVQFISAEIHKKNKQLHPRPAQISCRFVLFINCLIENPTFDSQTKEFLTTKSKQFGSSFQLTNQAFKLVKKSGVIESIINDLKILQNTKVAKKLKGKKVERLLGIPKLQDANMAGIAEGCTLILTEGDSAKSLAMSGIQVLGRDYYGVFPLRGKLLNVRQCQSKQLLENSQICNLIKIIGLEINKSYENTKRLRYSRVMIMADQDVDGSHIKGLILNFFQFFWPSLLTHGFLQFFITPLIKATHNQTVLAFFSQSQFREWESSRDNSWSIKYYKGLGTSTSKEGKEYFSKLQRHKIEVKYGQVDKQAIQLAFNKKQAEERKAWLKKYNSQLHIRYPVKTLTVSDFIHKQLIHFSHYDNQRSIPSVLDGLKPGQRKILFAAFKRNLIKEIKVAQFAGYVAQQAAYHHGQNSLCATIVGMAQNFTGSNNLQLFEPIGQFGTRSMGGKDSASPRYIYTKLSSLARKLFLQSDDNVLEYLQEEGQSIQPRFYLPIIPMILVNGASGIGTGWSSFIPPFNPLDLAQQLLKKINKQQVDNIRPYWRGFKGETSQSGGGWSVRGVAERDEQRVVIRELPIGKWTRDYKTFIQQKMASENAEVLELKQYHKDNDIQFVITLKEDSVIEDLFKEFKLVQSISSANMVAFDSKGHLRRYQSAKQIIQQFYEVRLQFYVKRRQFEINKARRDMEIAQNKFNFIKAIVQGKFSIYNLTKDQAVQVLRREGFRPSSQITPANSSKSYSCQSWDYGYLLGLSIFSFTKEKLLELQNEFLSRVKIYNHVNQTTPQLMWKQDLYQLIEALGSGSERARSSVAAITPPKRKSRAHQAEQKALAKETLKKGLIPKKSKQKKEQEIQKQREQKQREERQKAEKQKEEVQNSGLLAKYLQIQEREVKESSLLMRLTKRLKDISAEGNN